MALNLTALDKLAPAAVRHFWRTRTQAAKKQQARGSRDQGNRSNVTSGKNLDGFRNLVRQLIIDNGADQSVVFTQGRAKLTIPGFYRPVKNWDLLVVKGNQLLAAIEFKSQVGPSFGNNFNNRVEEAIGNATDLNTAFREGVFGESPKPFLGYFFILEECDKSMTGVRFTSPHFKALNEFKNASYAIRYEILCRKLVQEQLYDAAALLLSTKDAENSGGYRCLSELTSAKRFAAAIAGKVAGMIID